MIVEIEGKQYAIKVKETYMNQDKEFVEELIPLDQWAEIVRKKAISSLFHMEEIISQLTGSPVRLSEDYPEVKRPVLNLSGSVSRLPSNLIIVRCE